jgi:hypothetical protein
MFINEKCNKRVSGAWLCEDDVLNNDPCFKYLDHATYGGVRLHDKIGY